eukprot:m.277809 g.277809  ORF g.277809 m.277809 type:complete len:105 (+) comp54880_c0_seq1:1432-1746(+)
MHVPACGTHRTLRTLVVLLLVDMDAGDGDGEQQGQQQHHTTCNSHNQHQENTPAPLQLCLRHPFSPCSPSSQSCQHPCRARFRPLPGSPFVTALPLLLEVWSCC